MRQQEIQNYVYSIEMDAADPELREEDVRLGASECEQTRAQCV